MNSTFEFLATWETASDLREPTRLILKSLLTADTGFFDKKWAFGTGIGVFMTMMLDLRMAASPSTSTVKSTFWRTRPARLRWMQYCFATLTTDLREDCFETATARPFVAEIGTCMISALQRSSANLDANMLSFNILIRCSRSRV